MHFLARPPRSLEGDYLQWRVSTAVTQQTQWRYTFVNSTVPKGRKYSMWLRQVSCCRRFCALLSFVILWFFLNLCSIADQSSIVRVPLRGDKLVIHEKFFLFRLLQKIFLPKGYPDSVSDDYAAYQVWDTVQAFCSTICGMLMLGNFSKDFHLICFYLHYW